MYIGAEYVGIRDRGEINKDRMKETMDTDLTIMIMMMINYLAWNLLWVYFNRIDS